MLQDIDFSYDLTPDWDLVYALEEKMKDVFTTLDTSLKEKTLMVVSELVQNAVKYGAAPPLVKGIQFKFHADEKLITIQMINTVISDTHLKNFIFHIQRIQSSSNPQQLYTERLLELLKSPQKGESQLGLYRIAYEGGFELSYTYEASLLMVLAKKYLTKKGAA